MTLTVRSICQSIFPWIGEFVLWSLNRKRAEPAASIATKITTYVVQVFSLLRIGTRLGELRNQSWPEPRGGGIRNEKRIAQNISKPQSTVKHLLKTKFAVFFVRSRNRSTLGRNTNRHTVRRYDYGNYRRVHR
jgi:hypothetical protein